MLEQLDFVTPVSFILFLIVSLNYLRHAIDTATLKSLWLDEVLAVWTASQPDVPALWSALIRGSEFTPPFFDLMLHGLILLGFKSPLAMRAISIAAVYVTAVTIGLLVKRRSGWPIALFAAALPLMGRLYLYAIQARPYACVTAMIALALLLWDGLPDHQRTGWRAPALAIALTLAVGLHFYAIILVAGFAAAEIGWCVVHRRLRWSVWIAGISAVASILLWLPIMRSAASFAAGDVYASAYYGRPYFGLLRITYPGLFDYAGSMVVIFAGFLIVRTVRGGTPIFAIARDPKLLGLAVLCTATPVAIMIFAKLFTHSYAERYTLVGALGFPLLFSWLLGGLEQDGRWAALVMLAVLAFASFSQIDGGIVASSKRRKSFELVAAAPPGLPIATGNGGRYLELMEGLPPRATRNLVLVSAPPGGTDPTNQHQAERWGAIRPSLKISRASDFLKTMPCFRWLVDSSELHDDLPEWMERQNVSIRWLNHDPTRMGFVETRTGGCAGIRM